MKGDFPGDCGNVELVKVPGSGARKPVESYTRQRAAYKSPVTGRVYFGRAEFSTLGLHGKGGEQMGRGGIGA